MIKRPQKKTLLLTLVTVIVLYAIGLVNPYTSAYFRFPYYQVICGQKPVIASSFMKKTYHTSDMGIYYRTDIGDKLYCSEEAAQAAGYTRSLIRQK